MTPRRSLVVAWLGLVLYAFPGYMSYDSVLQLLEARDGVFEGSHPPLMGLLWRICDALVEGPLLMLLIQVTCFVTGAYLVLVRFMQPRTAAFATLGIAWFPPVAVVLAVIWKDSQMVAYLMLGTPLLLAESRRTRIAGLAVLLLATAMRFNALAITFPLVVLLFQWTPEHTRMKRYAVSVGVWIAITVASMGASSLLASGRGSLWNDTLALADITGTLRYAADIPDAELRDILAGTPVQVSGNVQAASRATYRIEDLDEQVQLSLGGGSYIPALWVTTYHVFARPTTDEQRAAISRAWRAIVLGNFGAYLTYRAYVTQERLQLGTADVPSASYIWFGDVLNIERSMEGTEHHAVASKLQKRLHKAMLWLGTSSLFRPWIYLALLLVCLVLVRSRLPLAIGLSGLTNELALFVLGPTVDYRYSIWLTIATLVALVAVIAQRSGAGRAASPPSRAPDGRQSAPAAP